MAFVTKMHEKHGYASPRAVQVKNRWMTSSIEDALDVVSWLEKGERNVHVCRNVRFADNTVCTICDNADRSM